jgi:CMP/dCMP kinase
MYRAMGLALQGLAGSREEEVIENTRIDVRYVDGEQHVFCDDRDVTRAIRTRRAGEEASRVARDPRVREKMVAEQRRIAQDQRETGGGIVIDGRDIGTVVFPDADVKIFMRADAAARAQRRKLELQEKGESVGLSELQREIEERDRQDAERSHSPLRQAEDALLVDTTSLGFEEQVAFVLQVARERLPNRHV